MTASWMSLPAGRRTIVVRCDAASSADRPRRDRKIFSASEGFVANQVFLSSAVSTHGTVIDRVKHAEYLESGNADHWYPVVRFTARTGQVVDFSPPSGSDPPQWPVGRVVGVLYDPGNPQHARINTVPTRWGWSVLVNGMLLGLGLGLCWIAFLGIRSWMQDVRR